MAIYSGFSIRHGLPEGTILVVQLGFLHHTRVNVCQLRMYGQAMTVPFFLGSDIQSLDPNILEYIGFFTKQFPLTTAESLKHAALSCAVLAPESSRTLADHFQ